MMLFYFMAKKIKYFLDPPPQNKQTKKTRLRFMIGREWLHVLVSLSIHVPAAHDLD